MDMYTPIIPYGAVRFHQWPCDMLKQAQGLVSIGASGMDIPACQVCGVSMEWHGVLHDDEDDADVLICNGDWVGFPADGSLIHISNDEFIASQRPLTDAEYKQLIDLAELHHPEAGLSVVAGTEDSNE